MDNTFNPVNNCLIAGNIKHFANEWIKLTSCPWINQTVSGCCIPLISDPVQDIIPFPFRMEEQERLVIDGEIMKLSHKGVIRQAVWAEGQFISNVFLRPKPNGDFRMILDLTRFNDFVEYRHFKMFSLNTARDLLSPGAFMASIDLKDAYYTVPMAEEHMKYLRFFWRGVLYEYTCMPNGLAACPRMFTRLLKPIFAHIGERGHVAFPYIDDVFITANTKEECVATVHTIKVLLQSLGFLIHKEKSVLTPTQRLKFLGFYLDSKEMTVEITADKVEKFNNFVLNLGPFGQRLKIRKVAALIGLMVAYSPAVLYGSAHIKVLERDKNVALNKAKGNFERMMRISAPAWTDIHWWVQKIDCSPAPLHVKKVDLVITTDASLQGWGAHSEGMATGGRWLPEEKDVHINVLELQAVFLGLTSLVHSTDVHIQVFTDNMTTLSYINKMGGSRSQACDVASRKIWRWAELSNNWLTASYIPGKENTLADFRSRNFRDHLEWELNPIIFDQLCQLWGNPEIDLFASRINAKCLRYVSWMPEPEAWRVNAFSFGWHSHFYYIFPPFSLVARVVRKVVQDQTHAVLVTPEWVGQPWLAAALKWANQTFLFPRRLRNLSHHGPLKQGGDVATTPLRGYLFSGKH